MAAKVKPVSLEDVRIGFRNFEGREGPYNKSGERSFAIFFTDHNVARELEREGWNIKWPREREDVVDPDENPRDPHLTVSVGFDNFPANVYLISNGVPNKIYEEEVGTLDWAELEQVDVVIRPYTWSVRGQTGIKAYLKAGYFTIVTDEFAKKYGI